MRERILFTVELQRHSWPCGEGWQTSGDGNHFSSVSICGLSLQGLCVFFVVDFIAVAAAPQAEKPEIL